MKKLLSIYAFILIFLGCGENNDDYIVFSGNIKNNNEKTVKVTNYNSTVNVEIPIDSTGDFSGSVLVEKGGYYFFQIGRSYTSVRFKKGKNVFVNIDAKDFFKSLSYSGELQIENNYNVSKAKLRSEQVGDPKDYFVVPLQDFLPKIEKTRDTLYSLLRNSNLSDSDKEIEKDVIYYEYLQAYNNYQKFYSYHKNVNAELPDNYYEPIINMDMDNDIMFRFSRAYRNLVIENFRLLSKKELVNNPGTSIIEFVTNQIKDIKSEDIREQYASMLIRQMKEDNTNIDRDYNLIMELLSTQRMKDKLTQRFHSAKSTKAGHASVEFNYENFDGGMTSLKDLKGKVLYIDVWATWCGPCIKEFPYLKKLIEDYKDKDIEFVSISIDSKNQYDKWRKMVADKNIGGLQLYDSEGLSSSFMRAFSVGLIPRFMMLDAEGKIITARAPRPSSEEVRKFIDGHLEKPKVMKFTSS